MDGFVGWLMRHPLVAGCGVVILAALVTVAVTSNPDTKDHPDAQPAPPAPRTPRPSAPHCTFISRAALDSLASGLRGSYRAARLTRGATVPVDTHVPELTIANVVAVRVTLNGKAGVVDFATQRADPASGLTLVSRAGLPYFLTGEIVGRSPHGSPAAEARENATTGPEAAEAEACVG